MDNQTKPIRPMHSFEVFIVTINELPIVQLVMPLRCTSEQLSSFRSVILDMLTGKIIEFQIATGASPYYDKGMFSLSRCGTRESFKTLILSSAWQY